MLGHGRHVGTNDRQATVVRCWLAGKGCTEKCTLRGVVAINPMQIRKQDRVRHIELRVLLLQMRELLSIHQTDWCRMLWCVQCRILIQVGMANTPFVSGRLERGLCFVRERIGRRGAPRRRAMFLNILLVIFMIRGYARRTARECRRVIGVMFLRGGEIDRDDGGRLGSCS